MNCFNCPYDSFGTGNAFSDICDNCQNDVSNKSTNVANGSFDRFFVNEQERNAFPTSLFDEYEEW